MSPYYSMFAYMRFKTESHLLCLGALLPVGDTGGGTSLSLAPPPVPRLAQAFSLGGGAGITFSGSTP